MLIFTSIRGHAFLKKFDKIMEGQMRMELVDQTMDIFLKGQE